MAQQNVFGPVDVRLELLAMAVWDRHWLRQCGDMVTADDFRPLEGKQGERQSLTWVVAGMALKFWKEKRTPIGSLIAMEVHDWVRDAGISKEKQQEIKQFLKRLKAVYVPDRTQVLQDRVLHWKKTGERQRVLKELIDAESAGKLSDDFWLEKMREGIGEDPVGAGKSTDWADTLEERMIRRLSTSRRKVPALMIDPLDALIRSVGRGHIGLWLAAYKMGKSMALIHTGVAALFQRLNVLYFSLEDPVADVEDRMDAAVTELAISDLGFEGPRVEKRFGRFRAQLNTRLRLVDGTEGLTVPQIEQVWERHRAKGFDADMVVVDYDDEIRASVRKQERRHEFADIYRDLRRFAAAKDVIVWTAAQAVRKAETAKAVTADMTAEDISKIRKVSLAIGIGQGEWGDDSRYLFVAAAKFDRQRVGCTIWSAPEKGLFYDREKTLRELEQEKKHAAKEKA